MIRVCSGFSPTGRVQYGERFVESFNAQWPREVELQVWVEEAMPMPREACRLLFDIPGAAEFHHRHADNAAAKGLVPQPIWKEKDRQRGYSFRTDAYKFWKQILIPQAAADGMSDGDVLIWIDADVETTTKVPSGFVRALLGDAEVCFLGRERSHSEIGFWAVRINPRTRQFLHDIALMYTTDAVFELPEWHSAYVWDYVRERSGLKERNLCPPGLSGHVWPRTPLARYMRHDKGPRKPK